MRISVAMATYNGAAFLEKQLESILLQSIAVDEVIIADDCSTDNTINIVENFIFMHKLKSWYLVKNKKNKGFSKNFLDTLKKCTGDLIFISDQDDIWNSDKVEIMCGQFIDDQVMAVCSSYNLIDGSDKVIYEKIPNLRSSDIGDIINLSFNDFIGASTVRGCAMCIRKDVIDDIPDLDLSNFLGHDWLINILAISKGKNLYIRKQLFSYRIHDNNVSLKMRKNKEKRINGIKESISAHRFLLTLMSNNEIANKVKKQISFDYNRLNLLENRKIVTIFNLMLHIKNYSNIYNKFGGSIRIFFGDILYFLNVKI